MLSQDKAIRQEQLNRIKDVIEKNKVDKKQLFKNIVSFDSFFYIDDPLYNFSLEVKKEIINALDLSDHFNEKAEYMININAYIIKGIGSEERPDCSNRYFIEEIIKKSSERMLLPYMSFEETKENIKNLTLKELKEILSDEEYFTLLLNNFVELSVDEMSELFLFCSKEESRFERVKHVVADMLREDNFIHYKRGFFNFSLAEKIDQAVLRLDREYTDKKFNFLKKLLFENQLIFKDLNYVTKKDILKMYENIILCLSENEHKRKEQILELKKILEKSSLNIKTVNQILKKTEIEKNEILKNWSEENKKKSENDQNCWWNKVMSDFKIVESNFKECENNAEVIITPRLLEFIIEHKDIICS